MEEKETKKSSKGKTSSRTKTTSKTGTSTSATKKAPIKKETKTLTKNETKKTPSKEEKKVSVRVDGKKADEKTNDKIKIREKVNDKVKKQEKAEVIKSNSKVKESSKESKIAAVKKDDSIKEVSQNKVIKEPTESEKELLEKTIVFDGRQSKNLRDVVNKLEEDKVVVDNKVIKRSKIKKVLIIILVILMVIIGLLNVKYIRDSIIEEKENNQTIESNIYKKVSKNYKSIDDIEESNKDSIIKEVKYENIKFLSMSDFEKKVMQKEDMIVMVSSTTCYGCITFEPIVEETLKKRDETIYRVDIANFTQEEVERFRTYYAFRGTPTLFVLKDGIVKADTYGSMSKDELTKWLDENA